MLRIRFPNGQCLQYNDVNDVDRMADGSYQLLRAGRPGETHTRYVVGLILPGTPCIYEWQAPCAITNPLAREMTLESALNLVQQHLRTLPNYKVAGLKQQLRAFNGKSKSWSHDHG